MLCDKCKKRKATVHITEIVNDQETQLHLCEQCVKMKGLEMQQHFSIADLLSELVDLPQDIAVKKEHIKLNCPSCGMSYADFKNIGRFGCARCYDAFRRALYPLFKKIHGTSRHMGNAPERVSHSKAGIKGTDMDLSYEEQVNGLKVRLAKAIELEEFEEAAMLRDKIRSLGRDNGQ